MSIYDSLNEMQRSGLSDGGTGLILAGAGSWKDRVLTPPNAYRLKRRG